MISKEKKMAQFVVRNIEDIVKARLQRRARRNGRSMEAEVRDILRNAMNEAEAPTTGLGTEIANLFAGKGLHSEIHELRGFTIKPPSFDE
jgi:plasmid stability protein